ncbi:MAG: hypothetical protein NMK33_02235 [Candidatus Cardinium sp.]|nr:hypothetical protein FPG78_04910 [Cardinium endosymbiont of Dermatophagoides farinae]UWW97360.1 MAG: hypothetical protein NMK33_02235 [Candidatus Cardinium sp.]
MEKRYRSARVGLLIGLLAFQSLSACVDTRQVLGSRDHKRSYHSPYPSESRLKHNLQKFGPLFILMLWTIGFPSWVILSHMSNRPSIFHRTHSDGSNAIDPIISPFNPSTLNKTSDHNRGISVDTINAYKKNLDAGSYTFDKGNAKPFKTRHWRKSFKRKQNLKLPYQYD